MRTTRSTRANNVKLAVSLITSEEKRVAAMADQFWLCQREMHTFRQLLSPVMVGLETHHVHAYEISDSNPLTLSLSRIFECSFDRTPANTIQYLVIQHHTQLPNIFRAECSTQIGANWQMTVSRLILRLNLHFYWTEYAINLHLSINSLLPTPNDLTQYYFWDRCALCHLRDNMNHVGS